MRADLLSPGEPAAARGRIPDRLPVRPLERLLRWESLLLLFLVLVFLLNMRLSPYFLDPDNLSDATFGFTEKAIVALPMALLIIAGDIDLSVAAIIALASTAMGAAAAAGAPTLALVPLGALVGLACGALNGWLVTRFAVPALIVTIGTMSLYRGIAFIVLGDQAYRSYPPGFAFLGQGYLAVNWEASVAEVHAALRDERDLALTTIATMLMKMEQRGLCEHRAEGRKFFYRPLLSQGDVQRSMVGDLKDRLFQGDVTALVSHLLAEHDVSTAELARLKALIAAHERPDGEDESEEDNDEL